MALLLDITSNPQEWTDGNWPRAHMNGDAGNGTYRWSFTWSVASQADWGAFFARPNGGIWMTSEENFEIYDTSDNLMISRAVTWTVSSTTTHTVDAASGSLTLAGFATGNGTWSFTPADIFTAGTLKAGGISGQSGWSVAGTFSDLDDTVEGTTGQLGVTLGAATAAGTGVAAIAGAGSNTLGALAAAADGHVPIDGGASVELGAAVAAGAGAVAIAGDADATMGAATVSGAGGGEGGVTGQLDATLGAVAGTGTGEVDVAGAGVATLGALAAEGAADAAIAGAGDVTMGALSSSGEGDVAIAGVGAATLGALTVQGSNSDFGPGVNASAIATYGHATASESAPGGYIPPGGGPGGPGTDMDGRTPTPVTSQASGSSFLCTIGRNVSIVTDITDNFGNTWVKLHEQSYGDFVPVWEDYAASLWVCIDGAGGADHTVSTAAPVGDETHIGWEEIKGAHHLADWSHVNRFTGQAQVSAPIDTTAPAWVYVDWFGVHGTYGAEGFVWTVEAEDESADPTTGWQVADSRIVNHTDGWFQWKRWRRYFAAPTSNIQLAINEATLDPEQPAQFFATAFQEAEGRTGSGAVTMGAATVAGEGNVSGAGQLGVTLGAATVAGTGEAPIDGDASVELGALGGAAAGGVAITGAGDATMGALEAAGAGVSGGQGQADVTLGAATLAGAGAALVGGAAATELGAAQAAAQGEVDVTGQGATTLGAAAAAGTGATPIAGQLAVTLGSATVAGGNELPPSTLGDVRIVDESDVMAIGDVSDFLAIVERD